MHKNIITITGTFEEVTNAIKVLALTFKGATIGEMATGVCYQRLETIKRNQILGGKKL